MMDYHSKMFFNKFNITQAGSLFLLAFPKEAIRWANENYSYNVAKADSAFQQFVALCSDFCHKNNVAVKWKQMYLHLRLKGFSNKSLMVIKK